MSKDVVVKSNRLITAIQNLSLTEARLVQLAIVGARETGKGLSVDTPLRVDAMRYAREFGVERHTAYETLLDSEKNLFNRQFTFISERGNPVKSSWIQQVEYMKNEGCIEIVFTLAVVKEITHIDGYEQFFTQYALEQTSNIKSIYALRLYELLIQWRSTGKTPILDLDEFRVQLGIGVNEYQRMHHFKARVLDLAVAQINEHTDITATYEQHKAGRVITGFTFKFKQKTKLVDAPVKPKKPEPPKASTSFAGLQLVLLKDIQKTAPEITEKYVRDYAEQSGLDIVQVLEKIKADYKAAEEFSLEKTD
jgi:plasmid replication initiation protein